MPNNNLLMIPRNVVKAALLFMPHDDVRFYLNGLHIKVVDGNVVVIASDGDVMFRYQILGYAGIDDLEVIIPKYIVKLALSRARQEKKPVLELDVDQHFLGDIGFRPITERYPDFDTKKLRVGKKSAEQVYSIDLLQRLQRANEILGDGSPVLAKLAYYGRCAVLDITEDSLAVVMAATVVIAEEETAEAA